jgi:hypothetical protein
MTAAGYDEGSSLLELTIAVALFSAVMASLFAAMHPVQGAFASALDVADIQQRTRIAVNVLTRDLIAAGAGASTGVQAGPLINYFAPVRPVDLLGAGPLSGTASDALSILYVPSTAVQTTLIAELPADGEILRVADDPGCPVDTAVCGISVGMTLLVYDDIGHVDTFTVTGVAHDHALVRMTSRPVGVPRAAYQAGSKVVEAEARTYWRKTSAEASGNQLMRDEAPVVEHLVGLTFDYFGDPEPPRLDAGVPTYGPKPPPFTIQTTGYPAGENCTFTVDPAGPAHVPRLPPLGIGGALVELTAAQLADGPWCPDEADVNRWDADVLRIRKVGITVRVEAALASLRGPAGALFANGGSSRSGAWVPDQVIHWEVAPRNLNLER